MVACQTDNNVNLVVVQNWVEIGVTGPPHGVHGEIKVKPTTDFPVERLGTAGTR